MIFLLIITFIAIIFLEVPELIKNKCWRELIVFFIFLIAAFIISLMYIMNLPIPNPMKAVEYIIKDVLHLNYK
ncbi:hypothetical protein ACJDT4_19905 [Clostridium neuense]|uniref:Uncharacterized protein n=1 Tax=Clostridium neuense TaxID=1728934 RepID=A0ABW8TME7_9CLOT